MRVRVERVLTDHGYGDGWVVLGPSGAPIAQSGNWRRAYDIAYWYTRALVSAA